MKKSKVKTSKKAPAKDPRESHFSITAVRMNDEDRALIRVKADKFAKGNVSAWLRHSAKMYIPKKGERIRLRLKFVSK